MISFDTEVFSGTRWSLAVPARTHHGREFN